MGLSKVFREFPIGLKCIIAVQFLNMGVSGIDFLMGHKLFSFFHSSLALLIGLGLLNRQNWARILAIFQTMLTFIGISAAFVLASIAAGFTNINWEAVPLVILLQCLCAWMFTYLRSPDVKNLFQKATLESANETLDKDESR